MNSKLIGRILKVLALAKDGGATEAEASAAMAMARKLMAEADLTMAELEAAGGKGGEGSGRVKESVDSRTPYPWKRRLMAAIAALNSVYCDEQYDYTKKAPFFKGYRMIGREVGVASTKVMYEYLMEAVTRVQRAYAGADRARWVNRDSFIFKEACCERIVERLRDQRYEEVRAQRKAAEAQRARQAATGSNLPVVVMEDFYRTEDDLNNDLRRGYAPGTTAANRAKNAAQAAANQVKVDALVAEGASQDVAELMVQGYTRERAEEVARGWAEAAAKEAQRAKRRKGREYRWTKADQATARRRGSAAFRAGYDAGDDVSLHRQADYEAKLQIN